MEGYPEMPEDEGWTDRADWLANTNPAQLAEEYRDMCEVLYQAGVFEYLDDTPATRHLQRQQKPAVS